MSDVTTDPFTDSLELVAERYGDPTDLVYKHLFEKFPDMKPLFMLDKDDSAKGNMLRQVLECFMDFSGEKHYAANFIACERTNHEHIGVPPETFTAFFTTIIDTFKEILGADWTPDMDAAWSSLIGDLNTEVSAQQ